MQFRSWFVPLAVAAALAALSPILEVHFLGDDFIWIHEASRQSLPGLFQSGYFEFVRPTNELFWWLMWSCSGTDPRGYHALALAVHALTALLLYQWIQEATGQRRAGFAALACFLVAPMHLEPLRWPSACSELLAGLFVLATLSSYRRWRLGGGAPWLAATLASLALAFGSKESSVCVVPGLVLLEATLGSTASGPETWAARARALAIVLLPSLLLLAAAALAVREGHGYGTWPGPETIGVWRAYTSRALLTPELRDALARLAPHAVDLAACAAVAAAAVLGWRRAPVAALHLAWLPFTVLPYALFVPHLEVSDRYFYLSSIAAAGAAGGVLARLKGPGAALWSGLLLAAIATGGWHLAVGARQEARQWPLPQPEAVTLPQALTRHRPGAPVFVYSAPQAEIHSLYACAVLGGLDLGQVRPWLEALKGRELPPGSVALFWDEFSHEFRDCTPDVARALEWVVAEGRAPLLGEAPARSEMVELKAYPGGRGWSASGLDGMPGGTWRTQGLSGQFVSPDYEVSPFTIQAVCVELEVHPATAEPGSLFLNWQTDERPLGQPCLEVGAPVAPGGGFQRIWLTPGKRATWWTQGRIRRLVLIPSSTTAEVRLVNVRIVGYPRY